MTIPIQAYLACLPKWDGTPRLDTWLHIYGGAEDTEHTWTVGRSTLVDAVRRALIPGCAVGSVLVLAGGHSCGEARYYGWRLFVQIGPLVILAGRAPPEADAEKPSAAE